MSTQTTEVHENSSEAREANGRHLVAISPDWIRTYSLPTSGTIEIGRSTSCDLVLGDAAASRRHLRLCMTGDGLITFEDLRSANGFRLNGALLAPGTRGTLAIGDRFQVGATHVIVQFGPYYLGRRPAMSYESLEVAVADACLLATQAGTPAALVRWEVTERRPWPMVAARLASRIPSPHCFAAYGDRHYIGLFSGLSDELVERLAKVALEAVAPSDPRARFGLVCAPRDGTSPNSLFEQVTNVLQGREPARLQPTTEATCPEMRAALELSSRAANSAISVLVLGETGVGKDVLVRHIHESSPRKARPLVSLNCAGFTESLLESELFGYEKGAFTGAVTAKPGLLEAAQDGTIFLDEIGDLPLSLQVKLLRVLESREVTRLGSIRPKRLAARFVAATNRDLEADCSAGKFRSDLYFRLAGIVVKIPPLRERIGELPNLCTKFIREATVAAGRDDIRLSSTALSALSAYSWPGNIRELRNMMERAVVLCDGDLIDLHHLPTERLERRPSSTAPTPAAFSNAYPLARAGFLEVPANDERSRIVQLLLENAGNQTRTARALGVSRKTLLQRLDKYGIARPQKHSDSDG